MLRREQVIGVVSSYDVSWNGSTGYSVAITDSRMIVGLRTDFDSEFWAVFPPGKDREPELAKEAEMRVNETISRKRFELHKDKLVKIIFDPPGQVFGGRLVFVTVGQKADLRLTVLTGWNPGSFKTAETLLESLLVFAPQILYDEKTGNLVRSEPKVSRGAFAQALPRLGSFAIDT
jgi:hypothetical protein